MSILLEARKAKILQILVNDYIENCEPVGSKRLAETYGLDIKSATIRNEMAELAEMGLLTQPHRSAGRIPSELGYRVFVDSLMERCSMDVGAGRVITEALRQKSEIEMLITAACRVLSELCGYVSAACYPSMKHAYINYISLTRYGRQRLLMVAAASNSYIIHRIVNIDIDKTMYSVDAAENFLNSKYQGMELQYITETVCENSIFSEMAKEFQEAIRSEGRDSQDRKFFFDGIGRLIRLPEFREAVKLEKVISVLENDGLMSRILDFHSDTGAVKIGSETGIPALSECSVIVSPYHLQDTAAGSLAIIGPTRMDYSHSLAALELVSEQLEIMLNSILR